MWGAAKHQNGGTEDQACATLRFAGILSQVSDTSFTLTGLFSSKIALQSDNNFIFCAFLIGNCNMDQYKTNKKDWWLTPMLMDDSPCGPTCPPDGCQ